jgi:four helix bundle protein
LEDRSRREDEGEFAYEKLGVWQKGMDLVTEICLLTKQFPSDERYGITAQLRRAAVSIPANLAEGFGRGTQPQLANFARISLESVFELWTELEIAVRTEIATKEQVEKAVGLSSELSRMLDGFIRTVAS